MPTAHTSTGGKSAAKRASGAKSKTTARKTSAAASRSKDAVALLKADHREVEKLFGQFEQATGEGRKSQVAQQICMELRVHTQIEEELFYPVARDFLKDDEIVNESLVEHQSAKDLIGEIEGMSSSDPMYEAKLTVLQEMVQHHVDEEEKELFPQLQKSDMDLKGFGQQLMARKQELMAEMGGRVRARH